MSSSVRMINESEKMLKIAAVTIVRHNGGICLQTLRKTREASVTIVGVLASIPNILFGHLQNMGHTVAWLVEALCYKSEDCGFDSR
jgi:hypothetical protein